MAFKDSERRPSEVMLGDNPHAALQFEVGKRGIERAYEVYKNGNLGKRAMNKLRDFLYSEEAK